MSKVGVKFPYTAENDVTYLATVLNTYEDEEGMEVATVSLSGTEDIMVVDSEVVPEGGGTTTILPLTVTSNGTYSEEDVAYSPVTVNVGGSGGAIIDDFAMKTLSGSISGNASFIASSAFASYNALTEVNFPSCTTIYNNAFYSCRNLTTISFPSCTTIGTYAFYRCYSLTSAYFPSCTSIGNSVFYSCSALSVADFPSCEEIGTDVFYNCAYVLSTINFPVCKKIGNAAFSMCAELTALDFPSCTSIGDKAFYNCYSISTASFPQCTNIGSSAFCRCFNLLSLYLLGNSVPTMSTSNTFTSTPIEGYTTSTGGVYGSIFVKESMLTSFQTAENWSIYSSRIVGLTNAQIEELENI